MSNGPSVARCGRKSTTLGSRCVDRREIALLVRHLPASRGETSPGRTPRGPESRGAKTATAIPIKSVSPAARVEGFRRCRPDRLEYHGPDADELISDAFLRTHCFETKPGRGNKRGFIASRYTPATARSRHHRTLWIDGDGVLQHSLHVRAVASGIVASRAGVDRIHWGRRCLDRARLGYPDRPLGAGEAAADDDGHRGQS